MRNVKCSYCAEYRNEWCEKIIDSPHPDILRDCQYFHDSAQIGKDTNVTSTDCISRQAAIDEIDEWIKAFRENGHKESAADACLIQDGIIQLPAAQPEIIRCKECKHSEHWYRDKRRCFLWVEDGIDVFDDGFCNYAERRTDE